MSKALESALLAVARMKAGSEIDPDSWTAMLKELRKALDDGIDRSERMDRPRVTLRHQSMNVRVPRHTRCRPKR